MNRYEILLGKKPPEIEGELKPEYFEKTLFEIKIHHSNIAFGAASNSLYRFRVLEMDEIRINDESKITLVLSKLVDNTFKPCFIKFAKGNEFIFRAVGGCPELKIIASSYTVEMDHGDIVHIIEGISKTSKRLRIEEHFFPDAGIGRSAETSVPGYTIFKNE